MRNLDLTPLLRSSIGFENLSRLAETAFRDVEGGAYPPYNIEKVGENEYSIQMAAAGFAEDELDITVQDNVLIVTGRAAEDSEEREFLHRGIAKRAFERRFQLAEIIKVTEATFQNGLLNIGLVREIPEHKKPRKINIGGKQQPVAVEGEKADKEAA